MSDTGNVEVRREWMPNEGPAWEQRVQAAQMLLVKAEDLLQVGLQLECAECKRRLIQTSNQYKNWSWELTDRRRKMVPVVSGANTMRLLPLCAINAPIVTTRLQIR